jgi:hypothetical protein
MGGINCQCYNYTKQKTDFIIDTTRIIQLGNKKI